MLKYTFTSARGLSRRLLSSDSKGGVKSQRKAGVAAVREIFGSEEQMKMMMMKRERLQIEILEKQKQKEEEQIKLLEQQKQKDKELFEQQKQKEEEQIKLLQEQAKRDKEQFDNQMQKEEVQIKLLEDQRLTEKSKKATLDAEAAAVTKKADENAKTKTNTRRIANYAFWGSIGLTTVASLLLWLNWLYYDSEDGLKWHIKRFLKKRNKYLDPRKDNKLLAKVLPVHLSGRYIDLKDVFSNDNEARLLETLDIIRGKQFPYMLIAPTGQGKSTLLQYFAYLLSANGRPTAYIGFRIADDGKQSEASAASASAKASQATKAAPATDAAQAAVQMTDAQAAAQSEKSVLLSISEQLCQYLEIPCGQSIVSRIRKGTINNVSMEGEVAKYRSLDDIMRLLFLAAREIHNESNRKQKVLLIFDEVMDLRRPSRGGSPSGMQVFKKLCERVRLCSTDHDNISIMFASSSSFLPIALEKTVAAPCQWRRLSINVAEKDVSDYLQELNYTSEQIARIIALFDVRLRRIGDFEKQKLDATADELSLNFNKQLDPLLNSMITPLQELVKLQDKSERSTLIEVIDRLAANKKNVRLTDLPLALQNDDAISRIMYLEENQTLRFQVPAWGEVWNTRRWEIV